MLAELSAWRESMPDQDYVPPHAVALRELARKVEADGILPAEVRAAFLEDLTGADPLALRAVLKAIGLDEAVGRG
jgi:hypothetical protein